MSQKVTPELAGKVIRADLKNIIDKVGNGKPLSGAERGMFETLRLDAEDLVRRRQMSLLSKWSNGKRLNSSELGEIGDLLPVDAIAVEPEPQVELKPQLRRTGYYHGYDYYAELYGSSLRTVKRWVSIGKKEEDRVPLDDAEDMRSWWGRNMSQQCPAEIMVAAVKVIQEKGSKAAVVAPAPNGEEGVQPEMTAVVGETETPAAPAANEPPKYTPRELQPVGEDEVGIYATLKRLRDSEVQTHRIWMEAVEAGNEGRAKLAQKSWTDLTTQVRQMEKDALKDAEERGILVHKQYAEQKTIEFLVPIERGTRGLYRRMCEGMGISINAETEELWNEECDRLFIGFNESILS